MRKRLLGALIATVMIFAIFALTACIDPPPEHLEDPVVELIGDTAYWDPNYLADMFEVSINGELYRFENSVSSKKLSDGQTLKVRAIGDGTNYLDSNWSNEVTYTKPINTYTVICNLSNCQVSVYAQDQSCRGYILTLV